MATLARTVLLPLGESGKESVLVYDILILITWHLVIFNVIPVVIH